MDRNKNFFRNFENRQGDFVPKRVIIKNRFAKIYPNKGYVTIIDEEEITIGYRYIKEFYITIHNSIPLKYLYRLAKNKKVYLIDKNQYIVGEIKCQNL